MKMRNYVIVFLLLSATLLVGHVAVSTLNSSTGDKELPQEVFPALTSYRSAQVASPQSTVLSTSAGTRSPEPEWVSVWQSFWAVRSGKEKTLIVVAGVVALWCLYKVHRHLRASSSGVLANQPKKPSNLRDTSGDSGNKDLKLGSSEVLQARIEEVESLQIELNKANKKRKKNERKYVLQEEVKERLKGFVRGYQNDLAKKSVKASKGSSSFWGYFGQSQQDVDGKKKQAKSGSKEENEEREEKLVQKLDGLQQKLVKVLSSFLINRLRREAQALGKKQASLGERREKLEKLRKIVNSGNSVTSGGNNEQDGSGEISYLEALKQELRTGIIYGHGMCDHQCSLKLIDDKTITEEALIQALGKGTKLYSKEGFVLEARYRGKLEYLLTTLCKHPTKAKSDLLVEKLRQCICMRLGNVAAELFGKCEALSEHEGDLSNCRDEVRSSIASQESEEVITQNQLEELGVLAKGLEIKIRGVGHWVCLLVSSSDKVFGRGNPRNTSYFSSS